MQDEHRAVNPGKILRPSKIVERAIAYAFKRRFETASSEAVEFCIAFAHAYWTKDVGWVAEWL